MTREAIRAALDDDLAVRATLEGEARGEPVIGQLAVGCVIRNRVHAGMFGLTYRAVCLAKHQFSCWWGDDANSAHVYQVAEQLLDHAPDLNPQLAWVTKGIVGGFLQEDVSGGALYYLTEGLYRVKPPVWAQHPASTITIGSQVFIVTA